MDEDEGGGGGMLGKKRIGAGEVDLKNKSGTAWSHSYLNQKPWHPLSYPNQRRKWIAEQTTAQRERRAEEVAREFAQEQEFFRQTAMISKKEKDKIEMMKAVSFMYVRPPGYNAESAKAAELEDERKASGQPNPQPQLPQESSLQGGEKKKSRPKDVFGRTLPTEEEFEVLKNAPRLETGLPARSKPFGVEVRNVKCARCGAFGHQSGDRECPLKDAIMPNEQSRLQRDDPLTSILAHTDSIEPLKWELKQKPGISPPRGGFKPDDPNQQIVAEDIFAEDIFDEYGGFLSGDGIGIPELLTNFTLNKSRKHSKSKTKKRDRLLSPFDDDVDREKKKEKRKRKRKRKRKKHKKHKHSDSSDKSDFDTYRESKKRLPVLSFFDDSNKDRSLSDAERLEGLKTKKIKGEKHKKRKHLDSSQDSGLNRHHQTISHICISSSSDDSDDDRWLPDTEIEKRWKKEQIQREKHKRIHSNDSEEDRLLSDYEREKRKRKEKLKREKHKQRHSNGSEEDRLSSNSERDERKKKENAKREKHKRGHSDDSDEDCLFSDSERKKRWKREKIKREKHKRRHSDDSDEDCSLSDAEREKRQKREMIKRKKYKSRYSDSSDSEELDKHRKSRRHSHLSSPDDSDPDRDDKRSMHRVRHDHNRNHYHRH